MPPVLRAQVHYGSPLFGYALSFALTSVTGVVSLAFLERAGPIYPFVFFYPSIAIGSFLGGVGPGLVAVVLGAVFAALLFPYPPAPWNWMALAVLGPLLAQGFAHLRHIHDRNRAIARELAEFKLIGDHATDWIFLLGAAGDIRYANLTACTDLGWTGGELTGRHIELLVPEAERPALSAALENARSRTAKPVEFAFIRRDKSVASMELGCTAVSTEEGQIIHAVARDIGERKRIERKLLEIRHWDSLAVLAGGMAHDFNNLLTEMMGNASLARSILPPDHETAQLLDGIMAAAGRSSDLVRLMLASAGYRSRYSEQLRMDQLLDWTLANRPLPANVRVARETEATRFTGDRRSFETLLWSLISNAAEAYGEEDGEVSVAIRSSPAPALEQASRAASFEEGDPGQGECLGIVVEDHGSGMSPEILKRAFDPFFSTRFAGRGLGLPAVRGIVRAYSGKLLLETAVGQGTRVEVWLPTSRE